MAAGRKSLRTTAMLDREFNNRLKGVTEQADTVSMLSQPHATSSVSFNYSNINIHLHNHGSIGFEQDFQGDVSLQAQGDYLSINMSEYDLKNQFKAKQEAVTARIATAAPTLAPNSGTLDLTFNDMSLHVNKQGSNPIDMNINDASAHVHLSGSQLSIEVCEWHKFSMRHTDKKDTCKTHDVTEEKTFTPGKP